MEWSEKFDVEDILPELVLPKDIIYDYDSMNLSRLQLQSDRIKYLYNKNNIKREFINIGFNVPELYHYSKTDFDIADVLSKYESAVAKPAHMSFSDNVVIKKDGQFDESQLVQLMNTLNKSTERLEPNMLKQTERGVIIEQLIQKKHELKVFVVWGCPLIADLRDDCDESRRIDFIIRENTYLNWNKEYELIQNFAKKIAVDFFRIDFLYDGEKLYATECAFMPSTFLPEETKQFICNLWSNNYAKYYTKTESKVLDFLNSLKL
jgi:hypothetical protein